MIGEVGDSGYLKIDNEKDRLTVVDILFANGYTVMPVRKKKDGRAYTYYIRYEINQRDMEELT